MSDSAAATRPLRVLVVDDEAVARRRLLRMLDRLPGIEVVGEAADGRKALEQIGALRPAVVLLDIRMPAMNGLELARQLDDETHVVFTTAYEEYAVQAFEAAAVDYLLKPIESERLAAALDRARRLDAPVDRAELASLLRRVSGHEEPPRVAARRGDTIRLFDPRHIARFHSEDGYTVFRHDGRKYLLDDSIVSLAHRLKPWGFLQVHRAEMVNLHHVKALRKIDDTTVVELADGQRAAVSRRHLSGLKKALRVR